MMRVKKINAHA